MDIIDVRLWDPRDATFRGSPAEALRRVWTRGRHKMKMNVAVGSLLQHKETGEFRYFHASSNNGALFSKPVVVGTRAQLDAFIERTVAEDFLEAATRQRPDTRWKLYALTNVTFYAYKMSAVARVGDGSEAPLT